MADEESAARSALDFLGRLQPDLRGAALFGGDDQLLAATGAESAWRHAGAALLAEFDQAAEGTAAEAHLATSSGEVFMVRNGECRLLAVTERFVLASLLSFDMRTVLRELEGARNAA